MPTDNARAARLDALFGTPAFAVAFAVLCNCFWGSAFPFIKLGYRLFAIDAADTASILCFAGVRFMLGSVLVLLASFALEGRRPALPRGRVLAECCALGLWQTTAQYAFYYAAVALLTGAFGGILNSTQSFLGVILAHFLYRSDRMTPAKAAGCVIGFAGVLVATNRQPRRRQRLGHLLHDGGHRHLHCLRALEQVGDPQGGQLRGLAASTLGVGGAALLLIGLALGGSLAPQDPLGVPVLLYLAFVSGAGYVLWALLMKNNPVSRISVFGLVNPVVQRPAVRPAQRRTPVRVAVSGGGLALVCAGIWLVNRRGKEAPQA